MALPSSMALEAAETPEYLRELPHNDSPADLAAPLRSDPRRGAGAKPRAAVQRPLQGQPRVTPAAEGIESPYDPEARYRQKCDTQWTGYMVHVSETCEPTVPHLLTHVHTTTAAVYEAQCTDPIHQALSAKDLAPREHFVDGAYISAALLATSRDDYGITLRGHAAGPRLASPDRRGLRSLPVHGRLGAAAGPLSAGQGLDRLAGVR